MALPHGGKGGGKAGARTAGAAGKRPDPVDSPSGDESGERSDLENMLWTKDTDLVLRDLVLRSGEVDWAKIATAIEWDAGTVTARECEDRSVFFVLFFSLTFIIKYQIRTFHLLVCVFFRVFFFFHFADVWCLCVVCVSFTTAGVVYRPSYVCMRRMCVP